VLARSENAVPKRMQEISTHDAILHGRYPLITVEMAARAQTTDPTTMRRKSLFAKKTSTPTGKARMLLRPSSTVLDTAAESPAIDAAHMQNPIKFALLGLFFILSHRTYSEPSFTLALTLVIS
jgi:hypothetical protein